MLQWQLAISYFSWPNIVFTVTFIGLLSILTNLLSQNLQIILLILPILFLIKLETIISVRSYRKNKKIKELFNFSNSGIVIMSFQSSIFKSHVALPFHGFILFILASSLWGMNDLAANYIFTFLSILFGASLIVHSLTICKAWKIKSKTAMI